MPFLHNFKMVLLITCGKYPHYISVPLAGHRFRIFVNFSVKRNPKLLINYLSIGRFLSRVHLKYLIEKAVWETKMPGQNAVSHTIS